MPTEMRGNARKVYWETRAGTFCIPKDGQEMPDDGTRNGEFIQRQTRATGEVCRKIQVISFHLFFQLFNWFKRPFSVFKILIQKIQLHVRQKRKLDEMYDQLRNEHESLKRSAIQPVTNFYTRNESDLFSNPVNLMDNREATRKGKLFLFLILHNRYFFHIMLFSCDINTV